MVAGPLAELARTAVHRASSVRLRGPCLPPLVVLHHGQDASGALELVVRQPAATIAGLEPGWSVRPVTAIAVDVAPVPLRERIRATVVIGGRLGRVEPELAEPVLAAYADSTPAPEASRETALDDFALLQVAPTAVRVTTGCGCYGDDQRGELVDLEAYRRARPDPLAEVEAEWLGHLVAHHGEVMAMLGLHAVRGAGQAGMRVRPCAIDRYGISFRPEPLPGGTSSASGGCRDVLMPFPEPVSCLCGATEGFSTLVQDLFGSDVDR